MDECSRAPEDRGGRAGRRPAPIRWANVERLTVRRWARRGRGRGALVLLWEGCTLGPPLGKQRSLPSTSSASRNSSHGSVRMVQTHVRIPTSTGRTQGVRNTGEHTGPTCLPRGLRVTQAASRQKGSSWIPSPRTSPSQTVGWPAAGHKRREGEKREEHSRIKVMTDAETR